MIKLFTSKKGFSLIELLAVVIIIAVLAAIAVPIYMSYVQKARSTEAQAGIAAIRTAYRTHYQAYGTTQRYTIEDALQDVRLGRATLKNWDFQVVGNPPRRYIAISTADFPEGEGKQVWYDVDNSRYHGYGIDEEISEDEILD